MDNTPFILRRADPFICRDAAGAYYFTATVPEYDRIILRHSSSLGGLKTAEEKTVWRCHTSGPMSKHIWAPELHFLWGKWYLYFAAGDFEDKWRIRPYVLECQGTDPMADSWTELGRMKAAPGDEFSFEAFSLDGTVFEHKGEYYFVWAEKIGVAKGISNLYIARLAAPDRLSDVQALLSTPDYEWEREGFWVNEGPAVLKREGKVFLTYSASATGACYCMGLLTAEEGADLLDPASWKKERYPIFRTDRERGIFGPGHNSFTTDEKGRDICVFHARNYEEIEGDPLNDPNRHTMLIRVNFEQGNPVFSGALYFGDK